jgi:hypothetical protein
MLGPMCGRSYRLNCEQIVRSLTTLLVSLPLLSISAAAQDTSAKPQDTSAKPTMHNVQEIGNALAACMQQPPVADHYQGMRITVRVSFNGHGELLGPPQFTYVAPTASDQTKTEYKNAILDALKRCTALSFSPELGAMAAGLPIILRFDDGRLTARNVGGMIEIPPARPIPPLLQTRSPRSYLAARCRRVHLGRHRRRCG